MNKIWKSFFSKKLGRFVVASENARSSTKANKSKNSIAVAVAVVGITFSAGALANEVVNSTGSQAFGEGNKIVDSTNSNAMGVGNSVARSNGTAVVGNDNAIDVSTETTTVGNSNIIANVDDSAITGSLNKITDSRKIIATGSKNTLQGERITVNGSFNELVLSDGAVVGDNNYFINAENLNVHGNGNFGLDVFALDSDFPRYTKSSAQEQLTELLSNIEAKENGQSDTSIFGSSNMVDGSELSVIGGDNAIYAHNSNVTGNNNLLFGSDTNIHGGSNRIASNNSFVAGNNNSIVNWDDSLGGDNLIVGNENNLNTLTETRSYIDYSGNLVSYDSLYPPERNALLGNYNDVTGSGNNIVGSSNGQRMLEEALFRIGDNLPNLESSAENSNIFGSSNSFTTQESSLIGNLNKAYNSTNVGLLGNYNNLADVVASKVIGNENSIGYVGHTSVIGNFNGVGGLIPIKDKVNEPMFKVAFGDEVSHPTSYPSFENGFLNRDGEPETTHVQILGDYNNVVGYDSVISGNKNNAFTFGSVLSGNDNDAEFISNTVLMGNSNKATTLSSSLIGSGNEVGGDYLNVTGQGNTVGGSHSEKNWEYNSELGYSYPVDFREDYRISNTTVSGNSNRVSSDDSQVFGNENVIEGGWSGDGVYNATVGDNSVFGNSNNLWNVSESLVGGSFNDLSTRYNPFTLENNVVLGFYNSTQSNLATIVGTDNTVNADNGISVGVNNHVTTSILIPEQLPETPEMPRLVAQDVVSTVDGVEGPLLPPNDSLDIPTVPVLPVLPSHSATIAVGANNFAIDGGVVLGSNSEATMDGLALGNFAIASANNVALGSNSIADGSTLEQSAYLVGGTATGEVNVGGRRITGVVAGSEALDAVNVEQLTVVVEGIEELYRGSLKYDRDAETAEVLFERSTLEGPTAIIGTDSNGISVVESGGTTLANVATAQNADEAVNKGQMDSEFAKRDDILAGVVKYDRDQTTNAINFDRATLNGTTAIIGTDSNGISIVESGGTTLANVATAENADEAVNKGQMDSDFAVRDGLIEKNAENIATNTADISVNKANIALNTENIATNTQNIATNTASITDIQKTGVFYDRDSQGLTDHSKLILGDGVSLTQVKHVANASDRTDAVNYGQVLDMFDGTANLEDLAGLVRYDRDSVTNAVIFNKATLGGDKVVLGQDSNGVSIVETGGTTLANVANAQNADEAINKGQFDSAFANLKDEIGGIKGAIQYEITESGDVNFGVSILKGDSAVISQDSTHAVDIVQSGGTKIKNLANAEFADEAVNLGQLNLAIANLNDTYGEATLGAVQYDINDGVVNYAKARLRGNAASITTDSNSVEVVEEGGTVIANVANATKADEAVNLGVLQSSLKPVQMNVEQNTTDINTINRVGVFFGSNVDGSANKSTLVLGDASTNTLTQIQNVANAENRTDAINYGQVIDMFGELPTFENLAGVVRYDRDLDTNEIILGKVTLGGDTVALGTDVNGVSIVTSGGTTLANVATAQNADEAVNKGQMDSDFAVRDLLIQGNTNNITINTQNIAVNTANIFDIQQTGVFFGRDQLGTTDFSKLILGNGSITTQIKNVADASDRSDAVNYGQVLDMMGNVATEADLAGVVKYEKNQDGSYNNNSLVLAGDKAELGTDKNGTNIVTSGGTTISNVANAQNADEAINKGQFDSAINDLLGSTVQYDRNEDGTVNKQSITLGGEGGTVITNVANGKIEIGSTDAVNGGQIAELIGSIEIPEQLVTQDATTKEINVATNKDGKVVNVNGTEGDRVIAGVADGKISSTSNEAITGKQLNSTNNSMAQFLGGNAKWNESTQEFTEPTYKVDSNSYNDVGSAISALDARDQALDSKINNLEQSFTQQINATNNYVRKVEKRLSAGIAQAMAMESAPYVAGKLSYAVGAAHHGGENAVGATFRLTSESGKWSVTTGIAGASEGDASVRVGISGVIN